MLKSVLKRMNMDIYYLLLKLKRNTLIIPEY